MYEPLLVASVTKAGFREQSWAGPRGRCVLARESVNVLRVTMTGVIDKELASGLTESLAKTLSGVGPFHSFFDMEAVVNYDSVLRLALTQVYLQHWSSVGKMAFFTRSRIVLMGAAVANIAFRGRVQGFVERAPFEAQIRQAVREA